MWYVLSVVMHASMILDCIVCILYYIQDCINNVGILFIYYILCMHGKTWKTFYYNTVHKINILFMLYSQVIGYFQKILKFKIFFNLRLVVPNRSQWNNFYEFCYNDIEGNKNLSCYRNFLIFLSLKITIIINKKRSEQKLISR